MTQADTEKNLKALGVNLKNNEYEYTSANVKEFNSATVEAAKTFSQYGNQLQHAASVMFTELDKTNPSDAAMFQKASMVLSQCISLAHRKYSQ